MDGSVALDVLVIDDEPAVREVLATHLRCRGHRATVAKTMQAGLEAIAQAHFDVVVADVLLPDGDGMEVLSRVVRSEARTRVIVMTGGGRYFGPEFFRRVATALGATVLQKPFEREAFLAAIEARPAGVAAG